MNERLDGLIKTITEKAGGPVGIETSVRPCVCVVKRDAFAIAAKVMKDSGFRLVAEWASDETPFGRGFCVYAAYNEATDYIIVKSELSDEAPSYPTITRHFPGAYRLERQIESLMGVRPEGHPDLRPWIKHEDWPFDAYPLRKTFDASKPLPRVQGEYCWIRAEGEGVFEVPVGPVHAGIIEPGHFRFQSVGEDIINLETRFGYVHKGIEKKFETLSWDKAVRLSGRVSGDSTVAHSIAFCMAIEAASGTVLPDRAMYLRAALLELERIANHLGDIGAICNDAAFAFLHYQFAILREKMLKACKKAFGHRLMMDLVVPGGVCVDITVQVAEALISTLEDVTIDFEKLIRIYEDNASLEDRVYGAGILKPDIAKALGVVGFVARSSGQRLDARVQNPFLPYNRIVPNVPCLSSGDVHARVWVRVEEVREAVRLAKEMLISLPSGPVASHWEVPMPDTTGFSAVEGWRGEIIYWVQTDNDRAINRCMVRDPSSVNWLSIEQAIRGNIVPDFPLCNKSFNQSYSGHDL